MSAAATRWAWQQALKPTAKLVLLALADRANAVGECWPSTARIVHDTGAHRQTIFASIGELETANLINVSRVTGRGNVYKLLISSQSEKPDQYEKPYQSEKPDLTSTKNRTTTSTKNSTQNLSIEPTNNLPIKTIDKSDISSPKTDDETHADPVADIFKYWQTTMNHPNAVFDNKRKSIITKALKNYTADQLKAAINGCAKSAWHMGQNDRQKIYDSLDLIFRSADKIEGFIQNSTTTPAAGVTNHATKYQKSSVLAGQIFGAAAQAHAAQRASHGGDGHHFPTDDGYLLPTLD